jgi:hypothetical protein
VNIVAGGTGSEPNGSVTLIAGGTVDTGNTAITGVSINQTGGATALPGTIGLYAAQPTGVVQFESGGRASAAFGVGTLTPHDIFPGQAIQTDGGTITVQTNGQFSNTALVSASGATSGRGAGVINITAKSIDVEAAIQADGAAGRAGTASGAGVFGNPGQNGGGGGAIKLTSTGTSITTGININSAIQADGGVGGSGGAGEGGGNAGGGGSINLTTSDSAITQGASFSISAAGAQGGVGGTGGNGNGAAAAGGSGGSAGISTDGGTIRPVPNSPVTSRHLRRRAAPDRSEGGHFRPNCPLQ